MSKAFTCFQQVARCCQVLLQPVDDLVDPILRRILRFIRHSNKFLRKGEEDFSPVRPAVGNFGADGVGGVDFFDVVGNLAVEEGRVERWESGGIENGEEEEGEREGGLSDGTFRGHAEAAEGIRASRARTR